MAKKMEITLETALERVEAILEVTNDLKAFLEGLESQTEKAEEKKATPSKPGKPAKKAEPEPEEEDDGEEVDIDAIIEEYGLDELEVADLETEIATCTKKVALPKKKTVNALAKLLAEQIANGNYVPADDEDGDAEEESGDEEEVDLESMSVKELLAFAEENEVEIPTKIKKDKAKIIALLEEELGEDEDDGEGAELLIKSGSQLPRPSGRGSITCNSLALAKITL